MLACRSLGFQDLARGKEADLPGASEAGGFSSACQCCPACLRGLAPLSSPRSWVLPSESGIPGEPHLLSPAGCRAGRASPRAVATLPALSWAQPLRHPLGIHAEAGGHR